jgi:hypothetical protein
MALIDLIAAGHNDIAAGRATREEAARNLAEQSDGGLTVCGAADLLSRHPGAVRAQYAAVFDEAAATLREITAQLSQP